MIVGSDQPKPATVEDVPDGDDSLHPEASTYSHNPPAPVSAPISPPPFAPAPEQVSPIAPPEQQSEIGSSGYFPDASNTSHSEQDSFTLPSAPSMPAGGLPSAGLHDPTVPSQVVPGPSSHDHGVGSYSISPPDAASTPQDFYRSAPPPPPASAPAPPVVPPQQRNIQAQAPPPAASSHYTHPSQPTRQTAYNTTNTSTGYSTDDMAMLQAQKHAKWAISALNFEDVPTAVRELQSALAVLGAR